MSGRCVIATVSLVLALASGCAQFYAEQADREVYGIVAEKGADAFHQVRPFSIKPSPELQEILSRCKQSMASEKAEEETVKSPAPAPEAPVTPEPTPQTPVPKTLIPVPEPNLPPPVPEPSPKAVRLSVADALRVAFNASREYQTQKETVYETALLLTFERYVFQPHPTWTGVINFTDNNSGNDDPVRVRTRTETSEIGASQNLADGMVIVGNIGLTALKILNQEIGNTVDSTLGFTFTQPLWRGAGREVVQENLVQAERNALYAVRTFARFEQDFAVSVASQYLLVLQQRDIVVNEYENYRSLVETRERSEWLAKAERLPPFQVDQAHQDELRAYNRWIVTRESYENALDTFKILLGLPISCEIMLDPKELERLIALGLQDFDIPLADATSKALVTRFDLLNGMGGVEDATRKIKVAENGLAGQIDLVASIAYQSMGESPQQARIMFNRGNYGIGVNIDMPIDRLTARNALRRTQISRDGAVRGLQRQRDNVSLEVRRAFRRMAQARESYENQKLSVALAERRVESTQLLLQAGRATQRDVLEAQRALVEARNALTGALVDHTIAGLEFQRDVGTLVVNEEGQIHGWNLTHSGG